MSNKTIKTLGYMPKLNGSKAMHILNNHLTELSNVKTRESKTMLYLSLYTGETTV